jgi:hypothetical protein
MTRMGASPAICTTLTGRCGGFLGQSHPPASTGLQAAQRPAKEKGSAASYGALAQWFECRHGWGCHSGFSPMSLGATAASPSAKT